MQSPKPGYESKRLNYLTQICVTWTAIIITFNELAWLKTKREKSSRTSHVLRKPAKRVQNKSL